MVGDLNSAPLGVSRYDGTSANFPPGSTAGTASQALVTMRLGSVFMQLAVSQAGLYVRRSSGGSWSTWTEG